MGAPACARLLVPWTSCPNLNPSGWDDISVWDLLRTKLRRKKKWKTSKDWTKMVAGYAWKTFSSLSGSLSFGAGFVWKLCVPTKSDWNTTKALLTCFYFFVFFCSVNLFAIQVQLNNSAETLRSFGRQGNLCLGYPMAQLFTMCPTQFTFQTK